VFKPIITTFLGNRTKESIITIKYNQKSKTLFLRYLSEEELVVFILLFFYLTIHLIQLIQGRCERGGG